MKRFLISVCALALAATVAYADVPDPSNCYTDLDTVGRLYLCPDGLGDCPASSFCVEVRNAANNPINNAVVEVLVGGQSGNYVGICPGQTLVANTNTSGIVCFNVAGGGCYKHQADAAVIRANGVTIREFQHVMSSDYTATDDFGIPGRWDHLVSPPDLSSFSASYQGGVGPQSCHDYNNDTITNPPDLSTFSAAYKGGVNRCP